MMLLSAMLLALSSNVAFAEPIPQLPPYQGAYQPKGVDEIGLWKEADESERKLRDSTILVRDEPLTNYVREALCRAVGPDRCGSVRIYIVRVPIFNASMRPNGTMMVYSGLLLRSRNEAELASVLGHEFGHFERRHSLKDFKKRRSGSDVLAWAAVLSGLANNGYQYQSTQLGVLGNMSRYQRDQEREADLLGLGYLQKSELTPQSASIVWQRVMNEADASAVSRGIRKPRYDSLAFFASHPTDLERAGYLSALAGPSEVTDTDGKERFNLAMKDWTPQFLSDQIKLNDFGASEYVINSLAEDGWTSDLWFARAELYRLRGNPRDIVNAIDFYQQAIGLNPTFADAYRGLGISLVRNGNKTEAQPALKKYLELSPNAADAAMVTTLISVDEG